MARTLETRRLLLRPWRDEDVEAWVAMLADPQVMEFFPSPYERADAEAAAARLRARLAEHGYGWWILEVKGVMAFAGIIALQEVPFEAAFTPALEVGWRLVPPMWGNGYATEGARAALTFAFAELKAPEVVAMTAALNRRSQRVMERLAMVRNPADDFENPLVEAGHRLRPHVLYRMSHKNFVRGEGEGA